MKILAYTLVSFLAIACIISCDDLLEEDPRSSITGFQTEAQFLQGVVGLYDVLNNNTMYGFNMGVLGELGTDTYTTRSINLEFEGIDDYTLTSSQLFIEQTYQTSFQGIVRANFYLSELTKSSFDSTFVEPLAAEARGIRALLYFNLVRLYGGVPLETEPPTNFSKVYTRADPADIYTLIVSDLKFAKENLPIQAEQSGRMTTGAAHGLLTKVYLTMAGEPLNAGQVYYDSALQEATEFISLADGGTYPYDLLDSYKNVFREINENNVEIVFDAQSIAGPQEGSRWGKWGGYGSGNQASNAVDAAGQRAPIVMVSFLRSFAEEDLARRLRNVTDSFFTIDGAWATRANEYLNTIAKFRPELNSFDINGNYTPFQTPLNIPILRFDDVLLMAAEAENEVNGPTAVAFDYLNRVRIRAGITPYTSSNFNDIYPNYMAEPAGINLAEPQDEFKEAIFWERAWELCYEGHRRFDLVRWGRLLPTVQNVILPDYAAFNAGLDDREQVISPGNIRDFHTLYPIPAEEMAIQKNDFEQNPGY